ncbi:2-phosphosulfolactate phosphatase [Eubacteriales bacterium mix99]|jgi:2-phosphosulfolactate phosphatase|nr:2-phosphosulfolactate phosphatase [Clostridiales bacterium]
MRVYATPDNIVGKELRDKTVVVVDVLRTGSTILTALCHGCKEVIPAVETEAVIRMSKNYEKNSFLLCGERNMQAIEGFHLSNSPLEYTREQVAGKTLLMTTTNGTKAICRTNDAREVLICGLVNVDAVAEYLSGQDSDIVFLCAGTNGQFSLEDIVAAGAVLNRLCTRLGMQDPEMGDLAVLAASIYDHDKGDLNSLLKGCTQYRKLAEAGLDRDITYCLTQNAAPVVGVYRDGVIRIPGPAQAQNDENRE